jgi:hypothetical protein
MPNDIILGSGVFSIGATAIAVTRGGGQFAVERSYKEIIADGDRGPVKDRIRKDGSRATLTLRALEMLTTNLTKLYPATKLDTTVAKTESFKAETDIKTADYNATVKFTGKTMSGKSVVITLENAINLGNIDWALIDKDEVVAEIVYTATYLETARDVEPWKVDFITP